jgi:tripartite-type tricarboxylate transporter receptor subunit TctC
VTEVVKAPGVHRGQPQGTAGASDFADLVKYLKANPGKVTYATPGNGTIGHMWGELFKSTTGTFDGPHPLPRRGPGASTT